MKLSVSAYRAHASAHKKILSSSYQTQFNYGSTTASHLTAGASSTPHQPAPGLFAVSSPLYTAPLHQLQTRNQAPTHPQCVTIYIEPCLSIYPRAPFSPCYDCTYLLAPQNYFSGHPHYKLSHCNLCLCPFTHLVGLSLTKTNEKLPHSAFFLNYILCIFLCRNILSNPWTVSVAVSEEEITSKRMRRENWVEVTSHAERKLISGTAT